MSMTLVRPDLSADFQSLQNDVNQLFSSMFNGFAPSRRRWVPPMDLVEDGNAFVLSMDVPGLERDDINVSVQDDVLTISGTREGDSSIMEDGAQRIERSFGWFERSIQLGGTIDPKRVEASCINGVLRVRIPKPRQAEATKVTIGSTPIVVSK